MNLRNTLGALSLGLCINACSSNISTIGEELTRENPLVRDTKSGQVSARLFDSGDQFLKMVIMILKMVLNLVLLV